jgi:hypothetical protein
MESPPPCRVPAWSTYIGALNLASITIVGDGRQCRIIHTGEIPPGERIKHRFYFKPSHAELVLATIEKEGVAGKPAAALAALIERTAAMLGATWMTPDGLRRTAAEQVAEITERVKMAGLSGKLKRWNASYKNYRQAQIEKGEPAIPHASYIERVVTAPTVKQLAMSGRMI